MGSESPLCGGRGARRGSTGETCWMIWMLWRCVSDNSICSIDAKDGGCLHLLVVWFAGVGTLKKQRNARVVGV